MLFRSSFLLLAYLFYIALRVRKNAPLISFGILTFFITILVESSVIPIKHVIFEHRMYLPSLGWTLVLTMSAFRLLDKRAFVIFFAVAIAACSILTYQRNEVWQDRKALWMDAISKAPLNPRPYYNLGFVYMMDDNRERAMHFYNKALLLNQIGRAHV